MERDRCHLEAEPDQEQAHPEQTHHRDRAIGELSPDQRQIGAAGGAVQQGDPVEQEPGGEGADEEVFEAGFG